MDIARQFKPCCSRLKYQRLFLRFRFWEIVFLNSTKRSLWRCSFSFGKASIIRSCWYVRFSESVFLRCLMVSYAAESFNLPIAMAFLFSNAAACSSIFFWKSTIPHTDDTVSTIKPAKITTVNTRLYRMGTASTHPQITGWIIKISRTENKPKTTAPNKQTRPFMLSNLLE